MMIYSLYSYVSGFGPNCSYILPDKAGTKMEMVNQKGQWVDIFWVEVDHAYQGFNATNSPFKLSATPYNKCIHDIPHMRNINYPIDIMGAVFNTETHFDNPARPKIVFYIRDNIYFDDDDDIWLETEGGLSDFRFNPCFLEVEVFRQSLLNNDFYVRRHGAMRPL
ncbi:hypothetical protein HID58_074419 [Brassica napus]|uniref:F-box associated domain-containing protein n=1 Tax=Brassica napus TaxID=3708 RepID=A0ABQ7YGY8_BRANA|nr:hypothetical protein HID58_074419 [Brassica napus]